MGPNQPKSMELLSGLAQKIPIVIASRKMRDQLPFAATLELTPFDLNTIKEYLICVGLPAYLSGDAYRFSEGNPLMLSLFTLAAAKSKNPADINKNSLESDFVSFIISEVTSEDVFELLEAASIVHSFTFNLLEHLLSRKVDEKSFQNLTHLSFVTKESHYWHIHDVVSKSIRQSLKQYALKRYYALKRRSLDYYAIEEHINPQLKRDYLLERMYLCEDDFARDIIFSMGINLERAKVSIGPATTQELPIIPNIWHDNAASILGSTHDLTKGYEDTARLVHYASTYIRMLRDTTGHILGYHATVPVCSSTFEYFATSPASQQYLMSLSQKELGYLQKTDAQDTDTYFIRHFVPSDLNHPVIRGVLLQDISRCCIKDGKRIVTTIPHPMMLSLVEGLGFREVPGIFDVTQDQPWPTYELDFRQTSIKLWLEWLVLGRTLPHWLHILLTYSKQSWQEQVNLVLDNLNNLEFLNYHPMSPLAGEIIGEQATRDSAGEHAFRKMIFSLISKLQEAEPVPEKKAISNSELGNVLKITFDQEIVREKAANILNLPLTTYYRRLKLARTALAEKLYDIAVEIGNKIC